MESFFGITNPTQYVLGVIAIVLLPGPNSMYVLAVAAARGVRAGYKGACGVFVGDAVLMFCAALGAASLMRAYPPLFYVIKYAGAAYLAWVGFQLVRGAWRRFHQPQDERTAPLSVRSSTDNSNPFRKALVISLLNPKAILFFLSFFIQFVDPAYAYPGLTFVILGAIVQFFSALYLSTLIFSGARLAQAFRRRRRLSASLSGGVGVAFLGFGAKLATASLN